MRKPNVLEQSMPMDLGQTILAITDTIIDNNDVADTNPAPAPILISAVVPDRYAEANFYTDASTADVENGFVFSCGVALPGNGEGLLQGVMYAVDICAYGVTTVPNLWIGSFFGRNAAGTVVDYTGGNNPLTGYRYLPGTFNKIGTTALGGFYYSCRHLIYLRTDKDDSILDHPVLAGLMFGAQGAVAGLYPLRATVTMTKFDQDNDVYTPNR